ncbi:FtsK/SpoIIIE domain-containing protein [Lactococcus ileimucosae]|uniref:FtsK/SpoIIIE domain-containing protein n=1 Tax=Lactococcus ileimucosae TaxID=2941329 RepID=UPI002042F1AE|nr:FtsK/SpoIIIE domain-containing protein [Lactococcus ileimucosae]
MRQKNVSKGARLYLWNRYDRQSFVGLVGLLLSSPSLIFYKEFQAMDYKRLALVLAAIFFVAFSLSFVLLVFTYQNFRAFSVNNYKRLLLNYLLKHNLVDKVTVKTDKGSRERKKLARIYVKQPNSYELHVYFPIDGGTHQEKFLSLSGELETTFFADFQEQNFINEKRILAKRSYVEYVFAIEGERNRIHVNDVCIDKKLGVKLMNGVYWNYEADPHLLIAGGTGGGKTVLLMSLLSALARVGQVDICDPKRSDFVGLKDVPVFKDRVFIDKESMMNCLREAVVFMDQRYDVMTSHSEYKPGKRYSDYGLFPKFILFDEWAAFIASLTYQEYEEVVQSVTQIVLKGRASGVFLILAMQRPDGEYLKTALRDNFMKRLAVGRLTAMGYRMIFGDENEKKIFKYIKGKIGRGYVANNGELAREFYSPFVPIEEGYDFITELAKLPVLEDVQAVQLEAPPVSNVELERAEAGQLEDKTYTITALSRKLGQPNKTVKTVIERLAAAAFPIREKAPYTEDDYYALQSVFSAKEAGALTLHEAIEEILADEAEYKRDFENFKEDLE